MPRSTKTTEKERKATVKEPKEQTRSSRVTKGQAAKFLSKVPEGNVFWCNDGRVLRDMRELRDALTMMSDQTFAYHSNEIKQDFSIWIREIVGDEKLAKDLEAASTREQAVRVVESRCDLLSSKMD